MRKELPILSLEQAFPPSPPCSCSVCRDFCRRPGWWTVKEAYRALEAGYGNRMMLEIAPEGTFGVLSPAFYGCEADFALQVHAHRGCCFLKEGLCQLHGTGLQPMECRFCHHDLKGQGSKCHQALEKDWHTVEGQRLVHLWAEKVGLWRKYGMP